MNKRKCPKCNSENIATERRPNGNSKCLDCQYEAKTQDFDADSVIRKIFDGNVHVMPTASKIEHVESKDCWCEPKLIQDIDEEHKKQVWLHKGYEELNQ